MKKKELIDLINNDCLYSLYDAEDIIPKEVKCVATDLEIDRHRWYSTCVNVYACEDGYVGIYGVNQLYSSGMTFSDCDCHCEALEGILAEDFLRWKDLRLIQSSAKVACGTNLCRVPLFALRD